MPTRAMCKVDVKEEEEFKDVREKEEERGSYAMEDLEEALPIRRGLSRFYNGKSRSFANLADAFKIKDIQELAKPDHFHIYKMRSKQRKNMLAPRVDGGAIAKRPTTSATNLALGLAMSNSESECNSPCSSSSLAYLRPSAALAISDSESNGTDAGWPGLDRNQA